MTAIIIMMFITTIILITRCNAESAGKILTENGEKKKFALGPNAGACGTISRSKSSTRTRSSRVSKRGTILPDSMPEICICGRLARRPNSAWLQPRLSRAFFSFLRISAGRPSSRTALICDFRPAVDLQFLFRYRISCCLTPGRFSSCSVGDLAVFDVGMARKYAPDEVAWHSYVFRNFPQTLTLASPHVFGEPSWLLSGR